MFYCFIHHNNHNDNNKMIIIIIGNRVYCCNYPDYLDFWVLTEYSQAWLQESSSLCHLDPKHPGKLPVVPEGATGTPARCLSGRASTAASVLDMFCRTWTRNSATCSGRTIYWQNARMLNRLTLMLNTFTLFQLWSSEWRNLATRDWAGNTCHTRNVSQEYFLSFYAVQIILNGFWSQLIFVKWIWAYVTGSASETQGPEPGERMKECRTWI